MTNLQDNLQAVISWIQTHDQRGVSQIIKRQICEVLGH